jgi:hypothetical protein
MTFIPPTILRLGIASPLFLGMLTAHAQKPVGNVTVGWTYLWADQGGGERSNLNGWYARPAINLLAGFSVFADFTNYYGSNRKGSLNSHGFTGGINKQFFPHERVRPSVFVEGGDIRVSNAGSITHSPAFLTGFGLSIPFHQHLSLALTPAEYILISTGTGTRNDFNAKAGLNLSF